MVIELVRKMVVELKADFKQPCIHNNNTLTPFSVAVEHDYYEIAELFLELGLDPNTKYTRNVPIWICTISKGIKYVKLVIDKGAVILILC